jgi:hypothetical protein
MFGRYVQIGGEGILVFCSPETPLSEVCRRAAEMFAREESAERENNADAKAFRAALQEAG